MKIFVYVLEIHPQSSAAATSFHHLVYIQTGTNVAVRYQETWSIAPKAPKISEENDGELHTQEHVIENPSVGSQTTILAVTAVGLVQMEFYLSKVKTYLLRQERKSWKRGCVIPCLTLVLRAMIIHYFATNILCSLSQVA